MADADEDNIPTFTHPTPAMDADIDLTDEAQDYRFLSALAGDHSTSLPRRGEKDFEPVASLSSQQSALDASRQAMHNALSYPRLHAPKNHLVGVYIPNKDDQWRGRCVRVDYFKSVYGRTMGQSDQYNRMWLSEEEALFLLERGTLDIRWPDERKRRRVEMLSESKERKSDQVTGTQEDPGAEDPDQGNSEDDQEEVAPSELPMSLQGAYASFIGKSGLTLERYTVFAGLRRLGYVVNRALTWNDEDAGLNGHARPTDLTRIAQQAAASDSTVGGISSLINSLIQYLFKPDQSKACPSFGPLVAPGLYRNYNDIFRALSLIPYHEASFHTQISHSEQPKPPFRIVFNVFKPNTPYRKSSPPEPDFRVAVIDARTSSVPTLEQIGTLLDSMPNDELPKEKRLEQRLKHGNKSVILAVVDMGVVSYMRLSEAGFGSAKLYKEKFSRSRKGGQKSKAKKG